MVKTPPTLKNKKLSRKKLDLFQFILSGLHASNLLQKRTCIQKISILGNWTHMDVRFLSNHWVLIWQQGWIFIYISRWIMGFHIFCFFPLQNIFNIILGGPKFKHENWGNCISKKGREYHNLWYFIQPRILPTAQSGQ